MTKTKVLLGLLAILGACGGSIRGAEVRSPAGYKVEFRDRGSFRAGVLTQAQVLSWLDARVAEWVALRAQDHDPALIRVIANRTNYLVIDDYRFPDSVSPTGYAYGASLPGSIAACIYSRAVADAPPAAPAWITRQNPATGKWSYGVIPPGGGLQVVGHELDHQIGLDHPLEAPPE